MINKKTIWLCGCSVALGMVVGLVLPALPEIHQSTYAQSSPGMVPVQQNYTAPRVLAPPPVANNLTPQEQVNIHVYEQANRSVVNITTKTVQSNRFFMMDIPREGRGEGSGVVIDRQGHIVTNYHVVEGARDIQVTLFDGKNYDAELVGLDSATDVALIKIEAPVESLFPVALGNSTGLKIGQHVFAIGNPFGFERTFTTGVISSLNRVLPSRQQSARRIKSLIQVDAAINPGNSGGPLLDSHGCMIGMNMAIASRTGESAGIGFAIPVNTIARVVPELIKNGRVVRGDLGILTVYPMREGLLILTLAPGGPAEQAGLRGPQLVKRRKQQGPFVYVYQTIDRSAADLIVAVDGKPTADADALLTYIDSKEPGERVVLTVVRSGKRIDVPVQLGTDKE